MIKTYLLEGCFLNIIAFTFNKLSGTPLTYISQSYVENEKQLLEMRLSK